MDSVTGVVERESVPVSVGSPCGEAGLAISRPLRSDSNIPPKQEERRKSPIKTTKTENKPPFAFPLV